MSSRATFFRLAARRRHLYSILDKVKLWPSRSGTLHGVRTTRREGEWIYVETHCGLEFRVRDSKHGRGKRQIKHGSYKRLCKKCRIPDWKIEKYQKSTQ